MIKESIKSNRILHPIARNIKKFGMFVWIKICYWYSKHFVKSRDEIKKYKDLYRGRRCFIVATGPSLTFNDLNLIKNEITFSMNSIITSFDKTEFRPTFYLIQDGVVERRLRASLLSTDFKTLFIGIGNSYGMKVNLSKSTAKQYKKALQYNFNSAYHFYEMCYRKDKYKVKLSDNCAKEIMDGASVAISALQLAVYMGFKEIYLLGQDCGTSASGVVAHFGDTSTSEKIYLAGDTIIHSFVIAKEFCDKHGVKVYNATRGGRLEVFPRVKLEEVLYR